MRVAVKNKSGVFIHSTTPRKARLLLKEKKAVIESNNPFTIRLLFPESECELKDSESLNRLNSGLLSEKDNTMCDDRKEIEELHNAYGDYIQPSLNVIMANPKNKRIKWCSKDSNSANGENSSESFVQTLYDACTMLHQQTDGRYYGNFVHIGKRGFELLQRLDPKRFWKMDNWVGIDDAIKVHYIATMPENNFIVSINNNYFKDRDKFIVGSIVDEECSENIESEEALKQQEQSDNNKSEKENIMSENEHSNCVQIKSKVHVIYGARHSGKSEILYDILNGKVTLGLKSYLVSYTTGLDKKKLDSEKILVSCEFDAENCKDPDSLAKYYISECKVNDINVLAIDDIDFMFCVNDEYSNEEYFRAVVKECKKNNIDLYYVTHNTERDSYFYLDENSEIEEAFYKSPHHIYERFSDVLTVIK